MNRSNLTHIIKESQKKSLMEIGQHHLNGDTFIFIKDPLPENVDILKVISFLKNKIPAHFLNLLDVIYVGQFDMFNDRNINATYKDGALYTTNLQDNEGDMIDDIIHEIAHAVEKKYGAFLYDDEQIKEEFLRKREVLRRVLKYEGYETDNYTFSMPEYNVEFDEFLFKTIGYPSLRSLSQHIYASPYAATSLNEYFADGFEDYFMGRRKNLKNLSPFLYSKLEELENEYNY